MATSGADLAIAIGTISAAGMAAAGLCVSLVINHLDRTRADKQAMADREAATQLASEERAAARADAERRHVIELLLRLGEQISRQHAYSNAPQGSEATQQIGLLLQALPAECAHTARQRFNLCRQPHVPGAVGEKLKHLGLASVGGNADPRQMQLEIAYDIDRYLTSPRAPSDVWIDVEEQQEWQRERWPRLPGNAPFG